MENGAVIDLNNNPLEIMLRMVTRGCRQTYLITLTFHIHFHLSALRQKSILLPKMTLFHAIWSVALDDVPHPHHDLVRTVP